ncbi:MAG: hypothetical protein KF824_04990 [Fimbriimonadaceae bacterium]|nr:MAG: hypothetical protein KF824_04990 [Fimbriimonadaceae bacterium]
MRIFHAVLLGVGVLFSSHAQALILDDFSSPSPTLVMNGLNTIDSHLEFGSFFGGSRGTWANLVETGDNNYLVGSFGSEFGFVDLANQNGSKVASKIVYGATGKVGNSFQFSDDLNIDLSGLNQILIPYQADGAFFVQVIVHSSTNGDQIFIGTGFAGTDVMAMSLSPADYSDTDYIEVRIQNYLDGVPNLETPTILLDEIELVGAVPEPMTLTGLALSALLLKRRIRK